MWTMSVDDRPFIRQVVYTIIADKASEEINEFDALMARYFERPLPPTPRSLRGAAHARPLQGQPRMSEVAPAVLVALLSFVMLELEEASQRAPIDGLKAGLKGMLWHGAGGRTGAGMWLKAATKDRVEQLNIIIYCATMPVGVSIPTYRLREIAYETAYVYGLSEAQSEELSQAMVDHLRRNAAES
jgi:hypothetical protein